MLRHRSAGNARIRFFHSNVSSWSSRARAYLAADLSDVLMVSEQHRGPEHFESLRKEATLCGRKLVFSAAWPSDRSVDGTSGGELLLFANRLHATGIDEELVKVVMHRADPLRRKWSAAILRLRGVSVLVVELYLRDTIGLKDENVQALGQLDALRRQLGLPVVLAGDFQVEPSEFLEFGWPQRTALRLFTLREAVSPVRRGRAGSSTTS